MELVIWFINHATKSVSCALFSAGKPVEDDLVANPSAWKEDGNRCVEPPFHLKTFLEKHRETILNSDEMDLFQQKLYKSDVKLLGHGTGKKIRGVAKNEV